MPTAFKSRLEDMELRLNNIQPQLFPSNISNELRQAIQELRSNKELIIREADKGSCIVLMNTQDYIAEGYIHLSDRTTYRALDRDLTDQVTTTANTTLAHHIKLGTWHPNLEANLYTQPAGVRTHFLKKVHKDPYSIRPIVSCSSGPTERLSGFLCRILSAHLDNVPSLVTNSQQVITTLDNLDLKNYEQITLVSLDVKSLYTSMPQAASIQMVLQRIIPTQPPSSKSNKLKNMLRDFLKIVISKNTFRFHNRFYEQTKGVAMGTKCAPPFANLFMAALEEKALATWEGTPPVSWLRFLDDVLMLWSDSQEKLDDFLEHLNNQMTHITFTMTHSLQSTTFLDLEIYKGTRFRRENILDTKLFIKPTNPQTFLHYTSCHPATTFTTIIKGEIIRALRATSDKDNFYLILSKLLARFMERGYPKEFFLRVARTITFGQQTELLTPHPRRTLPRGTTLFRVRHHPAIPSSEIWQQLADEQLPFDPMIVARHIGTYWYERRRLGESRDPFQPHQQKMDLPHPAPTQTATTMTNSPPYFLQYSSPPHHLPSLLFSLQLARVCPRTTLAFFIIYYLLFIIYYLLFIMYYLTVTSHLFQWHLPNDSYSHNWLLQHYNLQQNATASPCKLQQASTRSIPTSKQLTS